jgi:hypothetical protein
VRKRCTGPSDCEGSNGQQEDVDNLARAEQMRAAPQKESSSQYRQVGLRKQGIDRGAHVRAEIFLRAPQDFRETILE